MASWGRMAVWVALLAGLAAAGAPLVGRGNGDRGRAHRASLLLTVSAGAALVATALLARALVVGDYSLVYVADFSRRDASWPYRAAALWGGMAGSLLWLATLVGLAGLGAAVRLDDPGRRARVAAVSGGVVAVLVALVVAFADPFATLERPAVDGAGLTPILEHSAMLYHPPLLYLGLATLVGPFALTVSALIERRLDDVWLATVRRWSLLPWTLLAVGMVAGAHWAYVELGWGGYWAWDPVENTALLPWLAVTVLLHGARGSRGPRGAATARPPVSRAGLGGLACLPFVLALLGTLLTRSGATSSVHAFAESRAIGRALAIVVGAAVVAVAVLLRRAVGGAPDDRGVVAGDAAPGEVAASEGVPGDPAGGDAVVGHARAADAVAAGPTVASSRPVRVTVARLVAAHLAVVGATLAVVLAGTLWPLVADLRGGDGIAVEGTYFARFAGPLGTVALALVCLVPVAVEGRDRRASGAAGRVAGAVAVAVAGALVALALLVAVTPELGLSPAALGTAAGACVATAVVAAVRAVRRRATVGGHLAHAAVGLLALGIAGTATGGNHLVPLRPGESATVLGHEIRYDGVTVVDGPVAGSEAVVAEVTTGGQRLRPSLVGYPERAVVLAESSLRSTPTVDVQVTLRTARDDGTALLQVGVHPLQVVVWWGGLAVTAAGAFTTWEASRSRRRESDDHGSETLSVS